MERFTSHWNTCTFRRQGEIQNLGLVIIDEQHRFGVAQRAKMWQKNTQPPHVLVMTATLSKNTSHDSLWRFRCFCIDELPPGRKEIKPFGNLTVIACVFLDLFMKK